MQSVLEPAPALVDVAANEPEAPERRREPQLHVGRADELRPEQHGAEVVVLSLELLVHRRLVDDSDVALRRLGQLDEVLGMAAP